ncbi:MAG: hypothetical protein AVDCRST_MAG93-9667 [uncultured Chloroflexia bacterium]|uniref:Ribosomal protein L7/L12 C-terminal domain-containing protein n=1 Tax=uncultured Chloroflexia bacterium TaxID=1672391 RepID=A0A6J4NP61_9CHLR|nr:MAG: hypothetical protein AVDCRST_MAG93-9667 [uncultured Chloroflexia bacterium]
MLEPILRFCLVVLEATFGLVRSKKAAPYPYDKQSNRIELPAEIEAELRELVTTGDNVEAVKRVTRLTGAGLHDAKDYVDQIPAVRSRRR